MKNQNIKYLVEELDISIACMLDQDFNEETIKDIEHIQNCFTKLSNIILSNKPIGEEYLENKERNRIVENLIDHRSNMDQAMQHGTHDELIKDSRRFYETVVKAYESYDIETYYLSAAYTFLNNEGIS
jgi:hypothetical protein